MPAPMSMPSNGFINEQAKEVWRVTALVRPGNEAEPPASST